MLATNTRQHGRMRWTFRILVLLLVLWAVFFISPYVSLYGLANALRAKDIAAIEARVNLRAVRASVARQLIPAYLVATGRESELKGATNQAAVGMGASFAATVLEQYLSPGALAGFLSEPGTAAGRGLQADGGIGLASLEDAWLLFASAQTRGFRVVSFAVPVDKPAEEQFRLQMRIRGLGWRLVGIELPKPVLSRLVQELIKRNPPAT
jgi:Protein of unknown function (DUF2939)